MSSLLSSIQLLTLVGCLWITTVECWFPPTVITIDKWNGKLNSINTPKIPITATTTTTTTKTIQTILQSRYTFGFDKNYKRYTTSLLLGSPTPNDNEIERISTNDRFYASQVQVPANNNIVTHEDSLSATATRPAEEEDNQLGHVDTTSLVAIDEDEMFEEEEEEEEENEVDDPYVQIGIERDQLALGVKPNEFLKYIGTREQLIEKTLEDIDAFDRSKAEMEVAKFMMDAEMVNLYIQYGKEIEKDPDFVVPDNEEDKEGFFSFRTLIIAYLGYIAYDTFPRIFRNWVYDQQSAGIWQGTNIQFIDEWIEKTTPLVQAARQAKADAAAQSLQGLDSVPAATSLSEGALNSVDTIVLPGLVGSFVPDSIQGLIPQDAILQLQTVVDAVGQGMS